jgi:UDP-glucose 4-epimerase
MLVVNDLCRQAITTKKLLLRSSGLQRRDFITLQDVNRAVHHFLGLPVEKCADGLFNLGGECSLRIIDMVELIAERCNVLFGYKPEVIRQTQHQEVTNDLIYSIEKLKVTGFKIRGDIKTEVDDTLIFCFNEFGEKRGYE